MNAAKKMLLVPFKEDIKSKVSNINGLANEIINQSIPKKFQNKARNILDYINGQISSIRKVTSVLRVRSILNHTLLT